MKEHLKQKAIELIKHYYVVVYPYVGSSYMTGDEYPEQKFKGAKTEALFLVQNILDAIPSNAPDLQDYVELIDIISKIEQDFHDLENSSTSKNEFVIPAVIGELTCDSCGCHPNVIYTTSKGRFCERCKPAS